MTNIKNDPSAHTLQIHQGNSDPIVILRPDGTIEVNEKFTTTEAAKAFWDSLRLIHYQNYLEQQIIEKVLLSDAVKLLIGSDEWDLNEDEEIVLWKIINQIKEKK